MMGHKARHEHNGKFRCPVCSYSSERKYFVDRHMKSDHKTQPRPAEAGLPGEAPKIEEEDQNKKETSQGLEKKGHVDADDEQTPSTSSSDSKPVKVIKRKLSHTTVPDNKRRRRSSPSPGGSKTIENPSISKDHANLSDGSVSIKENDPPPSRSSSPAESEDLVNSVDAGEPDGSNMQVAVVRMLDAESSELTGANQLIYFHCLEWVMNFIFILVEGLEFAEEECRAKMSQVEKDIQAAYRLMSKVQEEQQKTLQVRSLQMHIDATKEKVRQGAEEVAQLTTQKEIVRKRLAEASKQEVQSLIALRMIECKVLHFQLQVIESKQTEEDRQVQKMAEEKAQRAAVDAECAEALAGSLKDEHDNLAETLNAALESHNGTSDGLSILQAELDTLQQSVALRPKSQAEELLKSSGIERLIRNYGELEKALARIAYLKTMVSVSLKEREWLKAVVNRFG